MYRIAFAIAKVFYKDMEKGYIKRDEEGKLDFDD